MPLSYMALENTHSVDNHNQALLLHSLAQSVPNCFKGPVAPVCSYKPRAVFVQALLVKMAKDELSSSVVLCIFQQCHRQVQFCPSAESCFWQMAAQKPQDSANRSKFILYEGETCWHLRSLKILWPFSGRIQDNSITQKGSRECQRGIFNMSFFFAYIEFYAL